MSAMHTCVKKLIIQETYPVLFQQLLDSRLVINKDFNEFLAALKIVVGAIFSLLPHATRSDHGGPIRLDTNYVKVPRLRRHFIRALPHFLG